MDLVSWAAMIEIDYHVKIKNVMLPLLQIAGYPLQQLPAHLNQQYST